MRTTWQITTTICGLLATAVTALAADILDAAIVSDRILMLRVVDGNAFYGKLGVVGKDRVELSPLDLVRGSQTASYKVGSDNDANFFRPRRPERIGRKTKGQTFVITQDQRYQWVSLHEIYLYLDQAMKPGATYTIKTSDLMQKSVSATIPFEPLDMLSPTLHVSQLGFVPTAEKKFAYASAWLGDLGPLDLSYMEPTPFFLVDHTTKKVVYTGRAVRRSKGDEPIDSQQPDERNHTRTPVWELDFSSFQRPGNYHVTWDRLGCSQPFSIADDVYRSAYITAARGVYHQRCGIALEKKYTDFTHPRCHHYEDRTFWQTTHRMLDKAYSDGNPKARELSTGVRVKHWGGYHDAGDWDREESHPYISQTLLLGWELASDHFADGELNIPEGVNRLPDILDEARWGADYYRRLQNEDGGVSGGCFADNWPRPGETAHTDSMQYYVYAPDPAATLRYAALAARYAWCVDRAGLRTDYNVWTDSAEKAWNWAQKNLRPGDEAKIRDERLHAAACLFRLTGKDSYHQQFRADLQVRDAQTAPVVWPKYDQRWGVWTYALTEREGVDRTLRETLRQGLLKWAREEYVQTAEKRSFRQAYGTWQPLTWGTQSVPQVLPLLVAHKLSQDKQYLWPIQTTCDAVLGGNALNMSWMTGFGVQSPQQIIHPVSWYDEQAAPVPGLFVMGPYKYTGAPDPKSGPWDVKFIQQSAYPAAKDWPPAELYFEARITPALNEPVVLNSAIAASVFGYLSAPAKAR